MQIDLLDGLINVPTRVDYGLARAHAVKNKKKMKKMRIILYNLQNYILIN